MEGTKPGFAEAAKIDANRFISCNQRGLYSLSLSLSSSINWKI